MDAIREGVLSNYGMRIQYGPSVSWFGKKAYIYTEISGAQIPNGAIVASYARIRDVDYTYRVGNATHGQDLTHYADGDIEMAECRVKFDEGYDRWTSYTEVDVRSYTGKENWGNIVFDR